MKKICFDILEKWAEYVNFDAEQKSFNLANFSFETHKTTKNLKHIIEDYDESGFLAVMTAKRLFDRMLKDSRITLFDAITDKDEMPKHKEMYDLFYSEEVNKAEESYISNIKALIGKITGNLLEDKSLSETFPDKVLGYTDIVIQSIDKCRLDVYKKSENTALEVTNFSTDIHVFPSLGECVLTLSGAPDGMYLCFIDIEKSADSYFGFFVKSNGNLFSVNDRIDEAFKGQHGNARNGRWAENKADNIFPYDFIFEYGGHDYKGYASTYTIDKNSLSVFKLQEDAYLPILVAMILIAKKYKDADFSEKKELYIDSLLKVNEGRLNKDENELMVLSKNEIVQHTNSINLDFDYNAIMDGSALDEFRYTDRWGNKTNHISAANNGQIFVDLYGEGFKIEPTLLSTQKLIGTEKDIVVPEFVGSAERFRAQAYVEIRKQLASYIRDKMYEEYKNFGGIEAVNKWFVGVIHEHLPEIKKMCVSRYVNIKTGEEKNILGGWRPSNCEEQYYISMLEDVKEVPYYEYNKPVTVNEVDWKKDRAYDMDTGAACTLFFVFRPMSYIGLENLFGEIPKIVKGWRLERHSTWGNSNLDMTDAVENVNAPFEYYESMSDRYKEKYESDRPYTCFTFAIGFSKRGFKALCKSEGVDIAKLPKEPKKDD